MEQWKNSVCRGYVIWARENLDFKPEDINLVVDKLHGVFDIRTIDEAEQHYQNSPY